MLDKKNGQCLTASNNSPLPRQALRGNEYAEIQDKSTSLVLQLSAEWSLTMNNTQPIKRLIIKSVLTAVKQHMEDLIQESSKCYANNELDLISYCENLSLISADHAHLTFTLENFDEFSTEELENLL